MLKNDWYKVINLIQNDLILIDFITIKALISDI